jgi:ferrochelatase
MTAEAIVRSIGQTGLEWRICYQSKIGPVEWIGPSTEAEVRQAGTDRRAVVVLPIAFVSEHSETLVELDVDYAEVACRAGVSDYVRVPTVGCHPAFVAGLARLVRQAAADSAQVRSESDGRRCPTGGTRCALGEAANSPFDLPTGFG